MNKLIALALVAGLAPLAFATDGNSASTTADAAVVIYNPVTLTSTGKLDFGKLVITDPTSSASVTLDGAKTASYSNCAAFNGSVSGAAGANLDVPIFSGTKDSDLDVTVTHYSATMTDCTIVLTAPVIAKTSTSFNFPVFGTLNIPAGMTGKKSGQVLVTVAYL